MTYPVPKFILRENVLVEVSWAVDKICLALNTHEKCVRSFAIPPQSLITWARKQNLLPILEYNSEREFVGKVYACLESIQEKISKAGAVSPFWNFTYSGRKIKTRIPKKEVEIHPIIHSLLSDQMLMASIEIIAEYQTGVGNLDFMFLATIKGKGIAKVCVEFKNAHSVDIYKGLETQLPLYMRNCGAEFGAYCVLSYKGSWFDKPQSITINQLDTQLKITEPKIDGAPFQPSGNGIRIFIFDLAKPESASKS